MIRRIPDERPRPAPSAPRSIPTAPFVDQAGGAGARPQGFRSAVEVLEDQVREEDQLQRPAELVARFRRLEARIERMERELHGITRRLDAVAIGLSELREAQR